MFIPNQSDVKNAMSLIRKHGVRAMSEADQRMNKCAQRGDGSGACYWMRLMVVIEFAEFRVVRRAGYDGPVDGPEVS